MSDVADRLDGGKGGVTNSRHHREAGLIGRAVREEWPIPLQDRPAIYESMRKIAVDSEDESCRVKAGAVIVRMVGQNQANEHQAAQQSAIESGTAQLEVLSRLRITIKGKPNAELPAKTVPAQDVTGQAEAHLRQAEGADRAV